jgi:hypothetical protein
VFLGEPDHRLVRGLLLGFLLGNRAAFLEQTGREARHRHLTAEHEEHARLVELERGRIDEGVVTLDVKDLELAGVNRGEKDVIGKAIEQGGRAQLAIGFLLLLGRQRKRRRVAPGVRGLGLDDSQKRTRRQRARELALGMRRRRPTGPARLFFHRAAARPHFFIREWRMHDGLIANYRGLVGAHASEANASRVVLLGVIIVPLGRQIVAVAADHEVSRSSVSGHVVGAGLQASCHKNLNNFRC